MGIAKTTTLVSSEDARMRQVLITLLSATFIGSLPLLLTMILREDVSARLLIMGQVANIGMLFVVWRGYLRLTRFMLPVLVFILVTALVVDGTGTRDNAVQAYFALIGLSALLLGPNASLIYAGLSSIAYTLIALGEMAGLIVTDFSARTNWAMPVYFTALIFLAAALMRVAIIQIQQGLARAERSELTVAERNRQLEATQAEIRALNTSLEGRVEERTQALEAARVRAVLIADISTRMTRAQDETQIVGALGEVARRYEAAFITLSYYHNGPEGTPIALQTCALQDPTGAPVPLESLGQTYFPLEVYPLSRLGLDSPDTPLFIEDFANDPRLSDAERAAGQPFMIGAMVIIPLRARGAWQAQLSLTWFAPHNFEPEFRDLITQLMPRLADNVAARRAYVAEQAARRQATLIAEVSARMTQAEDEHQMLSALRETLNFNDTAYSALNYIEISSDGEPTGLQVMALLDAAGNPTTMYRTVFPFSEFPHYAFALQSPDQPTFIEDIESDPRCNEAYRERARIYPVRAQVIIPLRARGKWQGQLTFSWTLPRTFDSPFRDLITQLMPRLADNVAARRAYVAEQTARRRAVVIAEAGSRMTRAKDEYEIAAALREITGFTDAYFASLSYWILSPDGQPLGLQGVGLLDASGHPVPLETFPNPYQSLAEYPYYDMALKSPDAPLFFEDIQTDPRCSTLYREQARGVISAQVMIPLQARGVWQGQLTFSWLASRVFDPELRGLITELMPRLADNVAARRAYLAEQAARRENERLYAEQLAVADRLREADEIKMNFLASMSHELRTPLNSILNFTRFVSSGMFGPINDRQLDALNKTLSSGKHLLNLINDVLDVTKIEANMLNLFVEPDVDINAELETVIGASQGLLEDKPITLQREIAPNLPPVVGDRRRIRQIMLNLLSNACKFTEEGAITVHASQQNGLLLFFVRDTGPGIPLGDQEIIFEAFRQSHKGLTQGGGTGLGLAIARRLAEAHEGRLWLESQPGQGATFYVELPISSAKLRQKLAESGGGK